MLIGIVDIIKNSVEFYIKNWKKFVIYLPILFIPTVVLTTLGIISVFYVEAFKIKSYFIISTLVIVAIVIAGALFSLWVTIALIQTMKKIYKNEELTDWKKTISDNSYLIWPVFLTSLMTTALVVIGSLLFLIPGLLFFIWYTFTFYAVVFDNKRGIEALKVSKALVLGRWWKMFLRIMIPGFIFGILITILSSIITYPINFLLARETVLHQIITNMLTITINILVTPLVSFSMILLYFSAKENPIQNELPPIDEMQTKELPAK